MMGAFSKVKCLQIKILSFGPGPDLVRVPELFASPRQKKVPVDPWEIYIIVETR